MSELLAPLCPRVAHGEICESPECEAYHPSDPVQAAAEYEKKGTRKICYFHQRRSCRRDNCKYLHVARRPAERDHPGPEPVRSAGPVRAVPPTVRAASQLRGIFKEVDARKNEAEDPEFVARAEAWERHARDELYRITDAIRRAAAKEGLLSPERPPAKMPPPRVL